MDGKDAYIATGKWIGHSQNSEEWRVVLEERIVLVTEMNNTK